METSEDLLENSSSSAAEADPVKPFELAVNEVERLRSQQAPPQDIRAACVRADTEHQRLMTFLNKERQTIEGLDRMLAIIRPLRARLWRLDAAHGKPTSKQRPNHQGKPHGGKNGKHNRPPPRPTVEIVYRRRGGSPSD